MIIMIDKVHKHNTLKITSVPHRNVCICVRLNMLTVLTSLLGRKNELLEKGATGQAGAQGGLYRLEAGTEPNERG